MKITVPSVSLEELKGTAPKAGWGVRAGKLLVERCRSAFPVGSWSLRSGTLRQGTSKDALCRRCLGSQGRLASTSGASPATQALATQIHLCQSPRCVAGLGLFAVRCSLLRGLGAQLRKHVYCERNDCLTFTPVVW